MSDKLKIMNQRLAMFLTSATSPMLAACEHASVTMLPTLTYISCPEDGSLSTKNIQTHFAYL